MDDAEFMSSWDDITIVSSRLAAALQVRGINSSIVSSTVAPLNNHSGLSGDLSVLTLTFEDATSMKLVLKRTQMNEESKKSSKKLGLYREGVFYSTIVPWIQKRLDRVPTTQQHKFIPQVLFAAADEQSGQKAIILDYYEGAVETGVYFPHSVHNVVRKMQNGATDESEESNQQTAIIRKTITLEAARIAASLHGSFYQEKNLLADANFTKHLRMVDWIQGKGKDSYLGSQQEVVNRWTNAKARWLSGVFFDGKVQLNKEFVQVMDVSCAQALNFDAFVSKWDLDGNDQNKLAWSLVHGDYHPGNFLYMKEITNADRPRLLLVDWEVVGVGSGPQDLGQFLISHTEPKEASEMVDNVAAVYRETLRSTLDAVNEGSGKKTTLPSLEAIKREIVYGGIERWVWLFAFMAGLEEKMPWLYMQFFHDQMRQFIVLNGVVAEDIGMPRP